MQDLDSTHLTWLHTHAARPLSLRTLTIRSKSDFRTVTTSGTFCGTFAFLALVAAFSKASTCTRNIIRVNNFRNPIVLKSREPKAAAPPHLCLGHCWRAPLCFPPPKKTLIYITWFRVGGGSEPVQQVISKGALRELSSPVLSLSDPVQGLSEDRQRTSGLKHPTHPVRAVATLPVLR